MVEHRRDLWKMTAIGVVVAAVTAVVTGVVVANRSGMRASDPTVQSPAASPGTTTPSAAPTVAQAPAAPAPATTAPEPAPAPAASQPARKTGTPSQAVVAECNRQASAMTPGPQDKNQKVGEAVKGGAIGALGGAAVGALGGAIADGGSGAGKGALIGGAVGAGGGSLYGIYKSKKNDERYRTAYASCMRSHGYTS